MNILKNLRNYGHPNIISLYGAITTIINPYRLEIACECYTYDKYFNRTKPIDSIKVKTKQDDMFIINNIKSLKVIQEHSQMIITEIELMSPLSSENIRQLISSMNAKIIQEYSFEQEYKCTFI